MVIVCAAPGCSRKKENVSTRGSSVQFHRFPLRKPDICAKWVKAMKTKNFKPNVNSYLCNAHFKDSDYDLKPTNAGRHLKPNAVPSVMGVKKIRKPRKLKIRKQVESDTDSKGEAEQMDVKDDEDRIEYFDVDAAKITGADAKSQLAGILENESKDALQVLIVGEDGRITNSDYVLKKEVVSGDNDEDVDDDEDLDDDIVEGKHNSDAAVSDSERGGKSEFVLVKATDSDGKNPVHGIKSEQLSDLWYGSIKSKLRIAKLEEKLIESRRKVRMTEMKCKRLEKKMSELKTLLKLLVLKRGRGEKNLSELLDEYECQLAMSDSVVQVKYEVDSNSSQCN